MRTAVRGVNQPSASATAPTPSHIAAATSHTSARNARPVAIGVNQKMVLADSIPCMSVVTSRLPVWSYTQTMSTRYAVRLAIAARMDSTRKAGSGIPPAYVPLTKTCCRKCHSPHSTPMIRPVIGTLCVRLSLGAAKPVQPISSRMVVSAAPRPPSTTATLLPLMKSGDCSDSANSMPPATNGAGKIAMAYQPMPTRHFNKRDNNARYPSRPSTSPVSSRPAILGPASMTMTADRKAPSACQLVLTSDFGPTTSTKPPHESANVRR